MSYRRCTYRVSAKALIATPLGLLLVKEDSEHWDLPGGGVEHFENPEDALHREVREEIGRGLTVLKTERLQAWATYDLNADRPLLFLVYPAMIQDPPKSSPEDEISVGYFSIKELETLPIESYLEKFRQNMISFTIDSSDYNKE